MAIKVLAVMVCSQSIKNSVKEEINGPNLIQFRMKLYGFERLLEYNLKLETDERVN